MAPSAHTSQWRIYIVKFWTPPGVQILSISCSFWEILAKLYVGAPPELVPPPRRNPGSATASHCDLLRGCHPPLIPECSATMATDSSKIKDRL